MHEVKLRGMARSVGEVDAGSNALVDLVGFILESVGEALVHGLEDA